jgi:hypothetical protein
MAEVRRELHWSLSKRLAFRFLLTYFLLHAGTALCQLIPLVGAGIAAALDSALQPFFVWVGKVVFGVEITVFPNGSGDTTYNWVQFATNLVLAGFATLIWTVLDRRSRAYPRLGDGLWIAMRFTLGWAMLSYGINKIFALQFPEPGMQRLLQTYGDSSPMGLMWTFMGASQPYTMFAGWLETMGGVLLCFRRTQLLGALWSAGVMANVFLLNMCYDIPVKIYSFHLLVMALVIAAPDAPRLVRLFFQNRPVDPADVFGPWTNPRLRRVAFVTKLAWVGITLPLMVLEISQLGASFGPNATKGEYEGTWEVREFRRDGVELPPLVTDGVRWRYFTVIDRPEWQQVTVQPMKGASGQWLLQTKAGGVFELRPMTTAAGEDASKVAPAGTLTVTRLGEKSLQIQGDLAGARVEAVCDRIEARDFLLLSRGFHWVNESPFSR